VQSRGYPEPGLRAILETMEELRPNEPPPDIKLRPEVEPPVRERAPTGTVLTALALIGTGLALTSYGGTATGFASGRWLIGMIGMLIFLWTLRRR
jgi:hypothetical protein